MHRLVPAPAGPVTVDELYDVARPPHPDGRPWLAVCMIASLDGSVALGGLSGTLSSSDDRAVLATLRRSADVVLVGAGTARTEGYGAPSDPSLRIGVVTRSGDVDPSSELFTSGAGFLVCAETTPDHGIESLRAGANDVDLPVAVTRLPDIVPGAGFVHVEGGPRLNGALLAAGLVDELHLTVAPTLVGGDGPRVTAGAPEAPAGFDLVHLAVDDGSFVYTRWTRHAAG